MENSKEDGCIFQQKLNKGSQVKSRLFFAFHCIIWKRVCSSGVFVGDAVSGFLSNFGATSSVLDHEDSQSTAARR